MVASLGKHRHVFREKDLLFEMDNQFIIKLITTKMVSHFTKEATDLMSAYVTFRMKKTSTLYLKIARMEI